MDKASRQAQSPPTPGERLLAALTQEQVARLLDTVFADGLDGDLGARLCSADSDLAATLSRLLGPPGASELTLDPSDHKAIEIWEGLVGRWNGHVVELGDEHGAYVNHEEHWHPPYFDPWALADDLEEVANDMLPWLDRAFPLVDDPGLFRGLIEEIAAGVGGYPEWFQEIEEPVPFKPATTTCVLRWAWLGAQDRPEIGEDFLLETWALEQAGDAVALDNDTLVRFFGQLPEAVCREIHKALRECGGDERLASVHSPWHRIRHQYDERFDPATHLRRCEEHLQQDWRYGQPLIDEARQRQDLDQEERALELTVASLLQLDPDEPWRPEDTLLAVHAFPFREEEAAALVQVLAQWKELTERRRDPVRGGALDLQLALRRAPAEWLSVFAAFDRFQESGATKDTIHRLFNEWREQVVRECSTPEEVKRPSDEKSWVGLLIDARRDPGAHQPAFREHTEIWLECCLNHTKFFLKHWRSLALLTRSVPQGASIRRTAPVFFKEFLESPEVRAGSHDVSLREALVHVGDQALGLDPLDIWKRQLHVLVPSPADASGSFYGRPACGMKALAEINRDRYNEMLRRWRIEFSRRRNLWAEMKTVGCPDPSSFGR